MSLIKEMGEVGKRMQRVNVIFKHSTTFKLCCQTELT